MPQLLIVILDDLKPLPELLKAWWAIGVSGATIMESVGAYRAESWLSRAGLGALSRLFEADDVRRRTILTAMDDDLVDEAIAEADRIVGGFDKPDSGVLLAVPLSRTLGIPKGKIVRASTALPPLVEAGWLVRRDTAVESAAATLNLPPTLVKASDPVSSVAQAMLTQPNVHVACVISEEGRLVGLIDLPGLTDNLFYHIMPEEFLSEVTDLERVMEFASLSRIRTAGDAMREPVWVKQGETVKEAFKRMHEHRLTGLPVVDDHYRVVGYINLLELLAVCSADLTGGREDGERMR